MEALIKWCKIILVTVICTTSCQANAGPDQNDDQKLTDLIIRYEKSKDNKFLLDLMIYGSNTESVLKWFEKNMEIDNDVLDYAGLTFFESNLFDWNKKAEATLLRSLRIEPQAGVARRLGDIYRLGKQSLVDSRKACEMYELAYKLILSQ